METSLVDGYYEEKSATYFSGVRRDYILALPSNPGAKILEIGCGSGDTGAAALSEKKCNWYCGIELNKTAAAIAEQQISEVLVGNVETLSFPWEHNTFDALIISEVLEHLIDPGKALERLHPLMRPGALVMASSPNVSHFRIIKMLIKGEWKLEDSGAMDRTHLRWFTPATYGQMFERCGYKVESIGPVTPMGWKSKLFNLLTFNQLKHLFFVQINLIARVVERSATDDN